jgi:hypothetical protein
MTHIGVTLCQTVGELPWWYGGVLMKFWGVANVLQPHLKFWGLQPP